ncbi:hypothetical protein K438DRAFT_1801550 [Mycena galopus ATCC 62051]|nr:hypothetical protein K438DRAFT_1801550 [Mycena galopus ATCC 62051]
MSETPSAKEQLAAHFDKSATTVRAYADPGPVSLEFESSYARPALQTSSAFFNEYPVHIHCIAIFSSLAIVPAIIFLRPTASSALSLLTVVSLSFLALCCTFVVSSAVILFFLSLLVASLVKAFFVSGFFTVLAISTYLAYRFVTLVRSKGREGVRSWAVATKTTFIPSTRREASDESAFIMDVQEPPPEDSFAANSNPKQEDF